jgi:hypothetical protein
MRRSRVRSAIQQRDFLLRQKEVLSGITVANNVNRERELVETTVIDIKRRHIPIRFFTDSAIRHRVDTRRVCLRHRYRCYDPKRSSIIGE